MVPVIICVDDEPGILESLSRDLRNQLSTAYEIETAESGEEALELIDELINERVEIAMIISDFHMPKMNGGELLEKVTSKLPSTAKVLLTGLAELQDISSILNKSKLDKYILKPWKPSELKISIAEALLTYQLKHNLAIHQSKAAERNTALELIAQVTKTGSFTWVPESNTINFSSQWNSTFQHTSQQNTLDWYFSLIHPDYTGKVKEFFHKLSNETITENELEFKIKDGKGDWRWVINSAKLGKNMKIGSGSTIIFIEQDITEHKDKEQLLINANQINTILQHVSEQIIFLTSDGKVIWANKNEDGSQCAETDFTCYEQWGHTCTCQNCPVEKVKITGESSYAEVKTDNGKIYAATASPIHDENGKVLGIVHSRLDITRQKEMEAKLQHNQKMESVGQLAAGIAHELNTPIQYISDNLNFLKRAFESIQEKINEQVKIIHNDPVNTDKIANNLQDMCDNGYELKEAPNAFADALYGTSHIAKIVSAMKDFTHPEGSSPETSDLNQIVSNAVTISKNEWKYVAEVDTDFEDEILNITCMPGSLLQVIINMIVNSSHAIADKTTDTEHIGNITIKTRKEGNNAIIELADNGTGIQDKHINNIFDPFFTTKEVGKGTGQGLAITHDIIVNKHKGKIDLKTINGEGTTFTLTLPIQFSGLMPEGNNSHLDIVDI